MNKEEKMMDALLHEHARAGAGDDAEFLASLEERLDEEGKVVDITGGRGRVDNRAGNRFGLGLGIAAGLTVAAVGFYGWHQQRQADRATIVVHEAENPAEQAEHGRVRTEVTLENTARSAEEGEGKKSDLPAARKNKTAAASVPVPAQTSPLPGEKKERSQQRPATNFAAAKPKVAGAGSRADSRVLGRHVAHAIPDLEFRDSDDFSGALKEDERRREVGRLRVQQAQRFRQAGNSYGALVDNTFKSPWQDPLSTFSVDVDTASYTNVRRMIQQGQSVPADAVRIEEMINYFDYAYPQPEAKHPFSVNVETASCPWNPGHRLVKVGLQGKEVAREQRPAANLVFLLDVSGSMNSQDKLPLLVDSIKILLKELNADDSVSIVVYAGAEGLALPPTYVNEAGRKTIMGKLNNFRSGGSTNGGAGIGLAYKMAKQHFVKGGVNRVILGTDGDFNVGVVGTDALVSMVESEAKSGVFMSVLGFGQGNLNDAMLEKITNKGNGNYYYIDNLREGRKVFLDDMMGTMVTIAKDVKVQIEFNPAKVKSYRLIGYANRMLKAEDFRDKRVDAGEIGAGHAVTALYEIVPGHAAGKTPVVDDLKYQRGKKQPKPDRRELVASPEMLTVKLAYKQPEATKETESTYFETAVVDSDKNWQQSSGDFKFASGVALFGMLQRQGEYAGQGTYQLVRQLAEQGRGDDPRGLRTEFSDLVRKVE